jgi:hypothetical protein
MQTGLGNAYNRDGFYISRPTDTRPRLQFRLVLAVAFGGAAFGFFAGRSGFRLGRYRRAA